MHSSTFTPVVAGELTMESIEYICRECLIVGFTITTPTQTVTLDMRHLFDREQRS